MVIFEFSKNEKQKIIDKKGKTENKKLKKKTR